MLTGKSDKKDPDTEPNSIPASFPFKYYNKRI